MMRRWVRVLVLLLTLGVTAGVIWKATLNEQTRGRMRQAAQQTDAVAADAILELIDLRSTLHAYVAPGQGDAFWAARAREQLNSIRRRLQDLEPAASAADHPLTTALASLNELGKTESRAHASVRDGQFLVAGDIIFTEARDQIDAIARDVSAVRQAMARVTSGGEGAMANEQSLLAGGLIAAWIFALILLVPVPARAAKASETVGTTLPEPAGLNLRLRDVPASGDRDSLELRRPRPTAPITAAAAPKASDAPLAPWARSAPEAPSVPEAALAPVAPQAPLAPSAPDLTLQSLATLCADMGRVSDAAELTPLLERAAALIGARGLVVWLAHGDTRELVPAVAHGYEDTAIARMGAIGADDPNVTAEAFRTQSVSRMAPTGDLPGAVAVPLLSASGASGVLAAEMPPGSDLGRAAALAGIVAAQLASLFPAPVSTATPSRHAHAN